MVGIYVKWIPIKWCCKYTIQPINRTSIAGSAGTTGGVVSSGGGTGGGSTGGSPIGVGGYDSYGFNFPDSGPTSYY